MIASLCTVVSQLEETTREVVTLSQQRHAKYQKEAEALRAENARLQAQLEQHRLQPCKPLPKILRPRERQS